MEVGCVDGRHVDETKMIGSVNHGELDTVEAFGPLITSMVPQRIGQHCAGATPSRSIQDTLGLGCSLLQKGRLEICKLSAPA